MMEAMGFVFAVLPLAGGLAVFVFVLVWLGLDADDMARRSRS